MPRAEVMRTVAAPCQPLFKISFLEAGEIKIFTEAHRKEFGAIELGRGTIFHPENNTPENLFLLLH